MTLTLLLQLTDEEQLYATAAPQPQVIEADQAKVEPLAPALQVVALAPEEEQA